MQRKLARALSSRSTLVPFTALVYFLCTRDSSLRHATSSSFIHDLSLPYNMSTRVVSASNTSNGTTAANGGGRKRTSSVMVRRKKPHPTTSAKQLASGKPVAAPSASEVKSRTANAKPRTKAIDTDREPTAAAAPAAAAAAPASVHSTEPQTTRPKAVAFNDAVDNAAAAAAAKLSTKPRRHRSGVTARRLVRKRQKSDQLLLAKAGINRLVDTCGRLRDPSNGAPIRGMHMSRRARDSLHALIENILARLAAEANELARISDKEMVTPFHVQYVFKKWAERQPGNFLPMYQQAMELFHPTTKDDAGTPILVPGTQQDHWFKMLQTIGTKVDVGLGMTTAANAGRELLMGPQ